MHPCSRRNVHRHYDRIGAVFPGLLALVVGGTLSLSGCQPELGPQSGLYSGDFAGTLTVQGQQSVLAPMTLEITLLQVEDGYSPPTNLIDALLPVGTSQSLDYTVYGLEQLLTSLGWRVLTFNQSMFTYTLEDPDQFYVWGWGDGYLPEGEEPATVNSCYMTLDLSGSAQVLADDRVTMDLVFSAWSYDYSYEAEASACSTKYGPSVLLEVTGELTYKNTLPSE